MLAVGSIVDEPPLKVRTIREDVQTSSFSTPVLESAYEKRTIGLVHAAEAMRNISLNFALIDIVSKLLLL